MYPDVFRYEIFSFSLLGPNIVLSTLFSNTLCICSSHNLSAPVTHRYEITRKIMLLNICVYVFRQQKGKILILFKMTGGSLQMFVMSAFAPV